MSNQTDNLARERAELAEINKQSFGKRLGYYTKKSGPGWLQSAITLGGGSLGSAMFLGVLGGFAFMWVQPLGMLLGVVMLSAIAYVTLSTGERPFGSINRHVSPVLGWGWLIATIFANIVWTMPQFSLANDAIQEILATGSKGSTTTWVVNGILLALAFFVIWFYNTGNKGIQIFEMVLKGVVGLVVICFFGVAIALLVKGALPWGKIFAGFIPSLSGMDQAGGAYTEIIAQSQNGDFWNDRIGKDKQNTMLAAFATAVGINMTFLLPYSMLRKGWGREHRGLSRFDLGTGLLIPFILATGCLVLAAATQLHGKLSEGKLPANISGSYQKNLEACLKSSIGAEAFNALEGDAKMARLQAMPDVDKKLAAMSVKPNAKKMSTALAPLVGENVAKYIFGLGVLAMAISTIIILMLINGFAFQEMLGKPNSNTVFRIGCFVSGVLGFLYPVFWSNPDAKIWFVVPASTFGLALLPIAYFTFTLMMNSKSLLKEDMPTGFRRIVWNTLLIFATLVATYGAIIALKNKTGGFIGPIKQGQVGFAVLALLVIGGLATYRGFKKSA